MLTSAIQTKAWFKLARYPEEYANGSSTTDRTLCPECAPAAERKWDGKSCAVVYGFAVQPDEPCSTCGRVDVGGRS